MFPLPEETLFPADDDDSDSDLLDEEAAEEAIDLREAAEKADSAEVQSIDLETPD